jgi:hypothetical protein
MDELLRTLDDYAEIVNRMYEYGYIGNISEKVLGDTRHFGSDHLIALIKANNVEPVIIKRERDCDNYPYQMEVNVGTHTLYCLLCQEKYDALIEEGILAEELLREE